MNAIEFETEVHHGTLKLPSEYQDWDDKRVRVILLEATDTPLAIGIHGSNPLKNSIEFEGDLVSPIDEVWDAGR